MKLAKPTYNNRITSDFGWRYNGSDYHSGIDYGWDRKRGVDSNNFIINISDGTVKHIGYDSDGWGNYIVMSYGFYFVVYAHLKSVLVVKGKKYPRGYKIAEMGNTGNSNGKHLHFEIRVCGWEDFFKRYNNGEGRYSVDPEKFYLEYDKRLESDLDLTEVNDWEKEAWVKAYLSEINDGVGPNNNVTEGQLMLFFDKLNLIGGKQ